jgi:Na+(H+)/acetate symporter ActP
MQLSDPFLVHHVERRATTKGVVIGGGLALVSSFAGVILSPVVWVAVLGYRSVLFPYDNPKLFSMPLAFAGIWLFSKLDLSERAQKDRAGSILNSCAPKLALARPAQLRFD